MIYSQRSDGLGTRVLTTIYAQILSDFTGVPMGLIWTPLGWPFLVRDTPLMHPSRILEIFESLHFFRDPVRGAFGDITLHEEPVSTELFSLSSHQAEMYHLSVEEIAQISRMGKGVNYDFPGPLFDFLALAPSLKQRFLYLSTHINWNMDITETISQVDRKISLHDCVAVHIRRGDIIDMLFTFDLDDLAAGGMTQILQRYTPLQAYFDEIDAHDGGIIVCTEDDGVVEAFEHRYGPDRIVSCSSLGLSENQRAVTDLMLLSKSRKIVAPVLSYFSQCAALIGDTPLHNTTWRLREATLEIANLIGSAEPERSRQVLAILYDAAQALCFEHRSDDAPYYEALRSKIQADL